MKLSLLDVVVLKVSLPRHKLREGAIGTIIEILDCEIPVYLVEFSDTKGVSYAIVDLPETQLMKVFHEPMVV